MPIDADPGNVAGTGLAVRDLTEQLRGSGAGNVILLIDACRNDGSRDGVGIGLEQQQGVITLFSCAPEQQSYEVDELKAGAFTYALLQGLRIQGEGNCATVARLAEHVRVQVPYLTQRYRKGPQNPYLVAEPVSKQNLILLPNQSSPADLMALKYAALQAENQGDRDLARDFWWRVSAISNSSDMEARQAIERLAAGSSARQGAGNFGGSRSTQSGSDIQIISINPKKHHAAWAAFLTAAIGLVTVIVQSISSLTAGQSKQPTLQPNQLASPIASETPTPTSSPSPPPGEMTFKDVPANYWARDFIERMAQQGIISGIGDGTFRPDAPVTRAQFAALINKAYAPAPVREGINFSDVPSNYWAFNAIQTASKGGYMAGYADGTFKPDQNIPRVQLVVAIANGMGYGRQPADQTLLTKLSDGGTIPDYAKNAVAAATKHNILVNFPTPETFAPNRAATRAEVSALIHQSLVDMGRVPAVNSSYIFKP
jgi:S-layer homology domain/Caspase domain